MMTLEGKYAIKNLKEETFIIVDSLQIDGFKNSEKIGELKFIFSDNSYQILRSWINDDVYFGTKFVPKSKCCFDINIYDITNLDETEENILRQSTLLIELKDCFVKDLSNDQINISYDWYCTYPDALKGILKQPFDFYYSEIPVFGELRTINGTRVDPSICQQTSNELDDIGDEYEDFDWYD